MAIVLLVMTALLAPPPAALDFEFFKSEVQPIFLAKRGRVHPVRRLSRR